VVISNIKYPLVAALAFAAIAISCASDATPSAPTTTAISQATPDEPAIGPSSPTTVISCPDCEAHSVDRVIDGDTLDLTDGTRLGSVRTQGTD